MTKKNDNQWNKTKKDSLSYRTLTTEQKRKQWEINRATGNLGVKEGPPANENVVNHVAKRMSGRLLADTILEWHRKKSEALLAESIDSLKYDEDDEYRMHQEIFVELHTSTMNKIDKCKKDIDPNWTAEEQEEYFNLTRLPTGEYYFDHRRMFSEYHRHKQNYAWRLAEYWVKENGIIEFGTAEEYLRRKEKEKTEAYQYMLRDKKMEEADDFLDFDMKPFGDHANEYIIPTADMIDIANSLSPFKGKFVAEAIYLDMHSGLLFKSEEIKIIREESKNWVVSPWYLEGGGTCIDFQNVTHKTLFAEDPRNFKVIEEMGWDFTKEPKKYKGEIYYNFYVDIQGEE